MPKVEVLYPFGGAKRGDIVDVPADKVGALRRLHWVQEIVRPLAAAKAKVRRIQFEEKESDIDGSLSEETEAGPAD